MGVEGTGGAHFLWNYCLSRMEASTCSLFYSIQPLTSMVISTIFLDEQITAGMIVGAVCVIGSVLYFSLWSSMETRRHGTSLEKGESL
jgi:drug/metabolite transporter (DMT)-like permease